jgi:hypothetical protein
MPARFDAARLAAGGRMVGLVRFDVWLLPLAPQIDAAVDRFRSAAGLVVDLRGNLGGMAPMVEGTIGHFVDTVVTIGTMRTRAASVPRVARPRLVTGDGRRVRPFAGRVAILVDEVTGSASEAFAGGMQAIGRARIFGDTTAGGVLPSQADRLPNGDILQHAIADYIQADGTRLEGRGVLPDEVEALGGRAALLARRSARLRGRVAVAAQGFAGDIEVLSAPPNRLVVRVSIPGMGEIVSGYDGRTGWSVHPATGPRLLEGDELAALLARAAFHAELHDSAQVARLETVGRERFAGKDCYKVRVVSRAGDESFEYFDVATGLLAGVTATVTVGGARVETTSLYDDYRRVGSLMAAMRTTERSSASRAEQVVTLTSVEYDVVPDEAFAPPAAVRALAR